MLKEPKARATEKGATTCEALFAQAQVAQTNIECFVDGRALPSSVF